MFIDIRRLLNIPFCIFFLARFDQLRENFDSFPEIRWIIRENGKIVAFFPLNYYSVEKGEEEEESSPSTNDIRITVFIDTRKLLNIPFCILFHARFDELRENFEFLSRDSMNHSRKWKDRSIEL